MQVLNWSLIKHPLNWLIILMMLFFAGIAGTLFLELLGLTPATIPGSGGGQTTQATGTSADEQVNTNANS
jgi:hypothetical protein